MFVVRQVKAKKRYKYKCFITTASYVGKKNRGRHLAWRFRWLSRRFLSDRVWRKNWAIWVGEFYFREIFYWKSMKIKIKSVIWN